MSFPVGPFRKVPVGGGLPVPFGIPTDGLELYLDTTLGMSGYAQAATVNPWFDQSGNGRDLARDVVNSQVATFRITDSLSSKAPTVRFQKPGADARGVYLHRQLIPNLDHTDGFTAICWIRSSSTPTVGRTIFRMQTGSRPEYGYASIDPNNVYAFATAGPGYTFSFDLLQEPTILCIRWVPPEGTTGPLEAWSTIGESPIPVLRDSRTPWSWSSALANEFLVGVLESLSSFVNCYDLAMKCVWSRALTDNEMLGAFLYAHATFGLD